MRTLLSFLLFGFWGAYQKLRKENAELKNLINNLWLETQPENTTRNPMPTEKEKAQEITDAYHTLKTEVVADQKTIADLQAQIAAGTPVTADQLAALNIVDTTAAEVEADSAPTPAPSTPAPNA